MYVPVLIARYLVMAINLKSPAPFSVTLQTQHHYEWRLLRVSLLSNLHFGVLDTVPLESLVITICICRFFTPIVLAGFQWRTSGNMFSQYSTIFLSILLDFNHASIWMLSVLPRIFRNFLFIRNIEEIAGLAVTWSLEKSLQILLVRKLSDYK